MSTILSGIQPSGTLHIGNYFGMIKQMLNLQKNNDLYLFIANYHSLTSIKNKENLINYTNNAILDLLALGIDFEKTTFFKQSDVSEVLELNLILSNITPLGLLERSHAFKDKISKGLVSNHGLYSYPILMASDILLYDTEIVPVGKDQIQHIEMTRDIAKVFNNTYGNVFKMPKELIDENLAIVPGTNGDKMSKSYGNTIDIFTNEKTLKKQINSIVTDSKSIDDIKDFNNCNIYKLCELFMNITELEELKLKYNTKGFGYGHFKIDLNKKITEYFEPFKEKREYFLNHPKEVKEIMDFGKNKAKIKAQIKLNEVKELIGL